MATLRKFGIVSLGILLMLSACNIINPKEDIPVYLSVDSLSFDPGTVSGGNSEKITDAWIFINDDLIGSFELPLRVPILLEGSKRLGIFAGIKADGNSDSRKIYPFYTFYDGSVSLKQGVEITVKVAVTYKSTATFAFIEDFEQGTFFQATIGGSCFNVDDPYGRVGRGARLFLDETNTECEIVRNESTALPASGAPVYLEIDYKCDNAFEVGLIGLGGANTAAQYSHVINPQSEWNKIYLNLSDAVSTFQATLGTSTYRVQIRAVKDASLTKAEIFLDNIKLLH